MSEKRQKIYMQLRLVRLAAQQWQVSIQKASEIFQQYHVFHYIADNYDLFHMWGDLAIFEDIKEYIHNKGMDIIGGKIANDNTNATINAFITGTFGDIESERAQTTCIELLLPERLQDQYCFRTAKAINCLEFIESEQV